MSVRRKITENDGIYFVTFTCARWLKLFEITDGYKVVYKWFDTLKSRGHYISGFVIMPNHVHALIGFKNIGESINKIVGNGKRFMAYELVKHLKESGNKAILTSLSSFVNDTDRKRGKLHEVFEPSFDWKECHRNRFIEQKLDYMHENPCKGEWKLSRKPEEYLHSSAKFYETGEQGIYPVMHYGEFEDIDLSNTLK